MVVQRLDRSIVSTGTRRSSSRRTRKRLCIFAGNVVFKTPDFGKTWEQISPDLTTNDPEKLKDAGGPIAIENSTAEYHSTIISIAESPVQKGQIWVGTDDGNLQLTTDGGKNWSNLIKNVPGVGGEFSGFARRAVANECRHGVRVI